jgi:hypothetical protein
LDGARAGKPASELLAVVSLRVRELAVPPPMESWLPVVSIRGVAPSRGPDDAGKALSRSVAARKVVVRTSVA